MTDELKIPEGFTRWDGRPSYGPLFNLLLRDGRTCKTRDTASFNWCSEGHGHDIIAYKVESP